MAVPIIAALVILVIREAHRRILQKKEDPRYLATFRTLLLACIPAGCAATGAAAPAAAAAPASDRCPNEEAGLTLPAGFCASIFADGIGHARHLTVAQNGVVYVNTWPGRYYGNKPPHAGGFLVALKDTTGAGRADVEQRFGEYVGSGGMGGTGIGLYQEWLYAEINDKIVRYALTPSSIAPQGTAEPVVTGLPLGGDHPMHPFAIDAEGMLYVDVASATNACQIQNRSPNSPGANPCAELETRGGVWRFDATRTNQRFSSAERYATGIRNAEGFGVDAAGHRLFVTQHGRDQLYANWPSLYQPSDEATLPAEELLLLRAGADYGWPECYFDPLRNQLVLAPEYGGNGGGTRGVCAEKMAPITTFPAHWAPNAMVFYDGTQFPARYRHGVFIAFHGSWDRAPYAQQGYNVVFQSLAGDAAGERCEIFADGFAGARKSPGQAAHRPTGLAVGPDGSLYVSDDVRGRIYRITYRPGSEAEMGAASGIPCPSGAEPAGPPDGAVAGPPEGTHTDAGAASAGGTTAAVPSVVALGNRIYHGLAGGVGCVGCHGREGKGTALGPDLTANHWLWSDGSQQSIAAVIARGVAQPKRFRAPMPPMGGAQLRPEEVAEVAAYVRSLSQRGP